MAKGVSAPTGMRDFLPEEKRIREQLLAKIRRAYAKHGFDEIETPALVDANHITASDAGENQKLSYRVLRRSLSAADLSDLGLVAKRELAQATGGPFSDWAAALEAEERLSVKVSRSELDAYRSQLRVLSLDSDLRVSDSPVLSDLALRFDLTLPLARYFATNRERLGGSLRSMQIGPVWRAERNQAGRYRQFSQCDIDIIGTPSGLPEVELLLATADALKSAGVRGFYFRLNDRRLSQRALFDMGFSSDRYKQVLQTIDKLDKIGSDGVRDSLVREFGNTSGVDRLASLLRDFEQYPDMAAANSTYVENALGLQSDDHWRQLVEIIDAVNSSTQSRIARFDFSLVRGLGYYTGPVFEITHPKSSGSIGGGGRYDGMVGDMVSSGRDAEDIPAAGISIGFERIVALLASKRTPRSRSIVVFYEPNEVALADLAALKSSLFADKYLTVRLERLPRNFNRSLEQRRLDGYLSFAVVDSRFRHEGLRIREIPEGKA